MSDTKVRMKPNQRQGKRLSVPLTEQDVNDLRNVESDAERLAELPGDIAPGASEAALVHAIFAEGMRAVKERQMEKIYREIAAEEQARSKARYERVKARRRGAPGVD